MHIPKVPQGTIWNGKSIISLVGGGQLYLMATGPINDDFDATPYLPEKVCFKTF